MPSSIGIDIGQQRDPTAIAVCEPEHREREDDGSPYAEPETHWTARWMERLPLRTPYPKIAERLAEVAYNASYRTGHLTVWVDATGVGKPIVDILRDALAGIDASIRPCYFTHGDKRNENGMAVNLGKAYLVSRLQALLQSRKVHLPSTKEARALAEELKDYEIRIGPEANDQYGAFKVGSHDDLVTALGLAVQVDPIGFEMIL